MANSNSLILTLKTSPEIILVKDTKTQEITVGDNKYEVVLKGLSFMKKMYEPGRTPTRRSRHDVQVHGGRTGIRQG